MSTSHSIGIAWTPGTRRINRSLSTPAIHTYVSTHSPRPATSRSLSATYWSPRRDDPDCSSKPDCPRGTTFRESTFAASTLRRPRPPRPAPTRHCVVSVVHRHNRTRSDRGSGVVLSVHYRRSVRDRRPRVVLSRTRRQDPGGRCRNLKGAGAEKVWVLPHCNRGLRDSQFSRLQSAIMHPHHRRCNGEDQPGDAYSVPAVRLPHH